VKEKVLVAAGGTGGHIYPALAIAEALKAKYANVEIEFVGTTTGVENEIIPKHGYVLHQLSIGRLHKSVGVVERMMTLLMLPFAIFKALFICYKAKPRFLLGVGGHASGPTLLGEHCWAIPLSFGSQMRCLVWPTGFCRAMWMKPSLCFLRPAST
jgi:UDP-N-acetylglucosamine--N-acetylmuramyl-(pentapeptide) pyrophosphoryl-undecaprenol N-acetylglucosamine transferase